MFISRTTQLVGYLLLIFLSISALHSAVLEARHLQEASEKPWPRKESTSPNTIMSEEGYFATINREVPSCPDPLHNR